MDNLSQKGVAVPAKRSGADVIISLVGVALVLLLGIFIGHWLTRLGYTEDKVFVVGQLGSTQGSVASSKLATSPEADIIVRKGAQGTIILQKGPVAYVSFVMKIYDNEVDRQLRR